MGMSVAIPSEGESPSALVELNTTPLIDVMLVLLVMLIITIPVQWHAVSIEMNGEPSLRQPIVHIVHVDFDGTVYWDNQALVSRAAVEAKMHQVGIVAAEDQPEVFIKSSELADYGVVAAVMASAQRNGVKRLGVVGNDQFQP